jgi:hypothetical protein
VILLLPTLGSLSNFNIIRESFSTPLENQNEKNSNSKSDSSSQKLILPPTIPVSSRGLQTTGPVAILEDADPWGFNSVENILSTNPNLRIDTFGSGSFGLFNLTQYHKVIISSDQDVAFYTVLQAQYNWLEDYVRTGGTLEIHAARLFVLGDWILPGGFGHIVNATENVDIIEDDHFLLHNPLSITEGELENWGSATHGYLNNTDETTVILTDGYEPVFIEARFDLGYILATVQPLEWGYENGYSDFLENIVWYVPTHESPYDGTLTGPVVILEDDHPWTINATQQILTRYGISFDVINSTWFGIRTLNRYQKVIISSAQSSAFYAALTTHRSWLEDYVEIGGILEIHAATQGVDWILPGGAEFRYNLSQNIDILRWTGVPTWPPINYALYHPFWIQEPELEGWTWSSHGYFLNTAGSTVICSDGAEAVFFENVTGDGSIIATAQTVEWPWQNFLNYSMFLENLILYIPHHLIDLQPLDYIDTHWSDSEGFYFHNFTFHNYTIPWQLDAYSQFQHFFSNGSLDFETVYPFDIQTYNRYMPAGTGPVSPLSWLLFGTHFIIMIQNQGLSIGSVLPIYAEWGLVVDEISYVWTNGLSYVCWNVTWTIGGNATYSYYEKNSGVMLYLHSPGTFEAETLATNLVVQPPQIRLLSPNGGESLNGSASITWEATDPNDDSLSFDIDCWDGTDWVSLTTAHTSLNYIWNTSTVSDGDAYRIRVTAYDGAFNISDESDGVFSVINSTVPPPNWLWIPVVFIVIIVIAVFVFGVYIMLRRSSDNQS